MISKKRFKIKICEIHREVLVEEIFYNFTRSFFMGTTELVESLKEKLGLSEDNYILEDFFWKKRFKGNLNKLYKKIKKMSNMNEVSEYAENLNSLRDLCYDNAVASGWHTDLNTGESIKRNKGEQLMLIVSEIAEAMEGERKGLRDDHLTHRSMAEVELADAIIRIMDYCGTHNYNIGEAVIEKVEYNKKRKDHQLENRINESGKKW